MRSRFLFRAIVVCIAMAALFCCNRQPAGPGAGKGDGSALMQQARRTFAALPVRAIPDAGSTLGQRVRLGHMLFFEPRLSASGVISCNTCHNLATGGVDNRPTSIGHKFQVGPRNAPTVLNSGVQKAQFWDGRAATLEEQAKGPVLNPKEMAMPDHKLVIERLRSIPEYREMFAKAFPGQADPVTFDNVAQAIADFEQQLLTPAPFDRFLNGDENALTEEAKKGLSFFMEEGCSACHNGAAVGGGGFAKFGVARPYPTRDMGRFEITGQQADKFVFKSPILRNIERTYPYFHDGSVWTLEEAVRKMDEHQLGTKLSESEVRAIVAFLRSLTGEIPAALRILPELPASAPETPKPL